VIRLGCVTSKVKFQVLKGGQNITCQPFKAFSQTPASHAYSATVPRLETIISREVLWRSAVILKISHPHEDPNESAMTCGVTDVLAPFPLHSLATAMTATIYNISISQNMADTLPILLRPVDPAEFARCDCVPPTALDYLSDRVFVRRTTKAMLVQLVETLSTARRSTTQGQSRQTGAVSGDTLTFNATHPVSFLSRNNNVLGHDANRVASTAYYHKGCGAWKLREAYAKDAGGTKRTPLVAHAEIYVSFEVTEPLLMSPFVFGSGYGE
jgi:hypothetical protein